MELSKDNIEKDYNKVKSEFQNKDSLQTAYNIASEIKGYEKILEMVFAFLVSAFRGKLRNDKKTPLVFHSIYLTKLMYLCGEKNMNALLTVALHDVLEDTDISEDVLSKQEFMKGREYLIKNLRILKEDKTLSREPDGENLPPRYVEHIKRLIKGSKEVVNTEIIDRFSDLMDLEYILELPEKEIKFRLKSKLIKVKSFVYNIIRNRKDFNKECFELFESKVNECEKKWGIKINISLINL